MGSGEFLIFFIGNWDCHFINYLPIGEICQDEQGKFGKKRNSIKNKIREEQEMYKRENRENASWTQQIASYDDWSRNISKL